MKCLVSMLTAAAILVGGLLALPTAQIAGACSGRVDVEANAAFATTIVLADAIEVGDDVNRAPPPGPASPPRVASSPPARRTPPTFALGGVGAVLRIVEAYTAGVNAAEPLAVDERQRAGIERELRDEEAGGGIGTTCAIGQFTSRFERGARYLVFARDSGNGAGLFVIARLPVDGDDVVLDDPLAAFGSSAIGSMTATLYHRFFEGIPAEVDDARGFARFAVDRISLDAVLRAVAFLRDDASIVPPDTGNAGLASGRR